MKIIVFAPHPDDESYGAGGSIIKWSEEGHEIHVIWFTDGRAAYRKAKEVNELEDCEETRITDEELAKIRLSEADAAGDYLGVDKENRHFLKIHDQDLKNNVDYAVEKIRDIVIDANRFIIPSDHNGHPDHQATHDIAKKIALKLNLDNIEFYVYNLYNPLKAQGEKLIKIKIGDLRFKVYKALKIHKSQFYTKNMGWQVEAYKEKRRERFGLYTLEDAGNYYNF